MDKILKLLKKDARMSLEEMAKATSCTTDEVAKKILKLEEDGIILGYTPIINAEQLNEPLVTALVEIKFSLSNKIGFEELSTNIAKMKEVESVHLMSGGYDIAAIINGKNIQEIAFFVNEKLSSMECVLSTTTHFVLKTYKEHGMLCTKEKNDKREVML